MWAAAVVSAMVALTGTAAVAVAAPDGQTYVVNDTRDQQFKGTDGICDADTAAGLQCTLREALSEANADDDHDVIRFRIGGAAATGVKQLPLKSRLVITRPVTINGYSQPEAAPNTSATGTDAVLRIRLEPVGSGFNAIEIGRSGQTVDVDGVVIRGLIIGGFTNAIETFDGADETVIAGNFLGSDASGTVAVPNTNAGIFLIGDRTRIGGPEPADRNLISGNVLGIVNTFGAVGTVIQGNLIGVQRDGVSPLGSTLDAIRLNGGTDAQIGGTAVGAGNLIAFSGGDGVLVQTFGGVVPSGNRIQRNRIFSNGGEAIDLGGDGSTPNDGAPDADAGPNHLQNKPVVSSAKTGSAQTTIKGTITSALTTEYRLEFFSSPGGAAEARSFIGSLLVTTDADGSVPFTFVPANKVPLGKTITATATAVAARETSELSAPRTVTAP